jgi:hypothetical protein
MCFVFVFVLTFTVDDVVVRAAFFKGTEYKDLHVNLGSWGTRCQGTGDQDPVPDWSMMSRAQIWTSPEHEEKRKCLAMKRTKVQIAESSSAVKTINIETPEGVAKRGSISVFNAKEGGIPNAVRSENFTFGVAPATPVGAPVPALVQLLLEREVPVLLWGQPSTTRSSTAALLRDHPQMACLAIVWYIKPGKARLARARHLLYAERMLSIVATPEQLADQVCGGTYTRICGHIIALACAGVSSLPIECISFLMLLLSCITGPQLRDHQ